ncbi:DUF3572 domain-containing protein [Shimia abyssi]|uniref:Uncharacterized protein DUF3572 n=1 Tax=Shimia abyssi TaxID=1662395 RepID=A0A2P8FD76_9RHOB|nr:DUF3572 domain-containing protein [Shimia abyssi]PSL19654.1 uncharacterized protein DUF3572 [Shimia abyssi]
MSISEEAAEVLALKALSWLVTNDELLPVFLGATGASVNDLQASAGEKEFLGSVLEFLTMDDAWVMAFCDAHRVAYEDPMMAGAVLMGTARTHWT